MVYRNILATVFMTLAILCSTSAFAVESKSPLGIGLFPPVQFPSSEYAVTGLRLSLVGVNREVNGLDLGLLGNVTHQTFKGSAIAGLFNYNRVGADIIGFQIATLANINGTGSSLYGIQLGLYNKVTNVYGLQLGLINVAQNLHGIQIGLINFNHAGPFKAAPIINVGF